MDPILASRVFNTVLVIIAIAGWLYYYIKSREIFALAPMTWLFNLLAFYMYRYFTLTFSSAIKNTDFLNLWSSILHTHALILLTLSVFITCSVLKSRKNCMEKIVEQEKKEAQLKNDDR